MCRTIYYNGIVYTADENHPTAEAFVVKDGRFEAVGGPSLAAGDGRKVDLQGRCVIPGLIDSHCHLLAGVTQAAMDILNLDPKTTPEALGGALMALARERGGAMPETVAALGIDLTLGEFRAEHIDRAIADRPVIVFSGDGHALLLNSFAMKALGIDRDTPDPSGSSYFVRDERGEPTGLVIEIPAMRPCVALIGNTSMEECLEALKGIAAAYSALGYTGIFEALSIEDDQTEVLEALRALDGVGELPLRVSLSFGYHGKEQMDCGEAIRIMKRNRGEYASEHIIPDTLKMIKDGTIEEHSALLLKPYSDEKGGFGSTLLSTEEMMKAARRAADEGFNIHIHAIGDAAVHDALDVLTPLRGMRGTRTIAHNQLYSEEDIARMTEDKGIFFQTTPHWMTGDGHTLSCLGPERYRWQFPVGTMQRNGVTVTFGSDSCLEPRTSNAFLGMYYACARGSEAVCGDENLPPASERITRMQSLMAYTINGARQLGIDARAGSITAGKSADFVIVDQDIIRCPIETLKDAQVIRTYFEGESKTALDSLV